MRYSVQRFGTWEWLDLDAKLTTDGPEWALSSYGVIDVTLPPRKGRMLAEDGRPIYEEWGTWIHAETGEGADRRRWSGIVTRSELEGNRWKLQVREWAGYLDGMIIDRTLRRVDADPADIIRRIWELAAPFLNVTVVGSTSIRLGTDSSDAVRNARAALKARKAELDAYTKAKNGSKKDYLMVVATRTQVVTEARALVAQQQAHIQALIADDAPPFEIEAALEELNERMELLDAARTSYTVETDSKKAAVLASGELKSTTEIARDIAQQVYDAAVEQERADGGEYVISPNGIADAYQSVNDLTKFGFEWTTETVYSEGAPELRIIIHEPHAGRVRDDLTFEQGVNIISPLNPTRGGDEYANYGVGLGAGEGRSQVRQEIANTTPRMPRPAIVEDRSLTRERFVNTALRKELRARSGKPALDEITVIDHAMCRIGSWGLGDDIRPSGKVPNLGRYRALHRIISWQMVGDTKAKIRLQLSSTV